MREKVLTQDGHEYNPPEETRPAVSLIASAIRTPLYEDFLRSLVGTSVDLEIIFVGPVWPSEKPRPKDAVVLKTYPHNSNTSNVFKYYLTKDIKPAQCYEIARRAATGELICWVADDCEFRGDVIGKAYHHWKSYKNEKLILSIQTKEYYLVSGNSISSNFCDMSLHSFYGGDPATPRMAPLGMMSREYLDKLGGIDRRYICGQYENDIVMRILADGGAVRLFGDKQTFVDIDHIGKMRKINPKVGANEFAVRPFARGYKVDREVLETSWTGSPGGKKVSLKRFDKFEPYEDQDIMVKSQSNNIRLWK